MCACVTNDTHVRVYTIDVTHVFVCVCVCVTHVCVRVCVCV